MSTHPGVAAQPKLAFARTSESFQRILEEHGGEDSLRTGVLIDLGFIVLFAAVALGLLVQAGGPWWLALVPALLDVIQDVLLLTAAGDGGQTWLIPVLGVTVAMYVAYLAVVGAVVIALTTGT